MAFNPAVKDFLEKHPNKTLIGFMWSLWWRFVLCVYGAIALVTLVILGFGSLLSHSNGTQAPYNITGGYGNATNPQNSNLDLQQN